MKFEIPTNNCILLFKRLCLLGVLVIFRVHVHAFSCCDRQIYRITHRMFFYCFYCAERISYEIDNDLSFAASAFSSNRKR